MSIGITSATSPKKESSVAAAGCWEIPIGKQATDWEFLQSNWYVLWERCVLPDRDWRGPIRFIEAASQEDGLLAILPLAQQSKGPLRFWSLAGNYEPFRGFPSDCAHPERTACTLVDAIESIGDIRALRMGPVRTDDSALLALCASLARRGWLVHRTKVGVTFEVEPGSHWDSYFSGLGTGLKRSIRYDEKLLSRLGGYRLAHFGAGGAPFVAGVVSDLAEIESASWLASGGGTPRFSSSKQQMFWTEMLYAADLSRHFHVWIMYSEGKPVSFCFAVDAGRTRYIVANNYSESVSKYSTGSILYSAVFRDAIESRGIRTLNIGLGDSGYKQRWGAKPGFELEDIVAFRPGVIGKFLDAAYRLREKVTSMRG